jgi:hypothetical protein
MKRVYFTKLCQETRKVETSAAGSAGTKFVWITYMSVVTLWGSQDF